MFHQISVFSRNRHALRFLWIENSNEVVCDYKMNVHLFGKNGSHCVSNFALETAGTDKRDIIHKSVATSIDQVSYMEDLLLSDSPVEKLI